MTHADVHHMTLIHDLQILVKMPTTYPRSWALTSDELPLLFVGEALLGDFKRAGDGILVMRVKQFVLESPVLSAAH